MAKKVDDMLASNKRQLESSSDEDEYESQGPSSPNMVKDESENVPFDKKSYRFKKYSNKYKLQRWEEQRKEKMMKAYKASVGEEAEGSYKLKSFDFDDTDATETPGKFVRHPEFKRHAKKPKHKDENSEQDEDSDDEKVGKKKEEQDKKRQETWKKLSRKTRTGQPDMASRMEKLFDKIKNSTDIVENK